MNMPKLAAVAALLIAVPALAEEKVIADEEIAVSAGQSQMRGFAVPEDLTGVKLTVTVAGKKHTDKGFTVLLLQGKGEWDKYRTKKPFQQVEAFHGLKVKKFTHTGEIPPGEYALVVTNSENMMNGMTADVRMTGEPLGINPDAKKRSMDRVARIQLIAHQMAVKAYFQEKDRLPATLAEAEGSNYDSMAKDPWGNVYVYKQGEKGSFEVISYGPDGKAGGGDDINTSERDSWPKPGERR
jgi:hypothetical protein